jgi:hypothetical protein
MSEVAFAELLVVGLRVPRGVVALFLARGACVCVGTNIRNTAAYLSCEHRNLT